MRQEMRSARHAVVVALMGYGAGERGQERERAGGGKVQAGAADRRGAGGPARTTPGGVWKTGGGIGTVGGVAPGMSSVHCVQLHDVWPAPARGHGDSVCAHGPGPHFGNLLQLNMSDTAIAATHAPPWQQAIMKAMAHYGMYVEDTNGPGNLEMSLIKEDDRSFTSFGYPGEMRRFIQSASGAHSAAGAVSIAGVPIDLSTLRVIDPCVPRRTC